MSKLSTIINKILAGTIALLGFSGCSTDDGPGNMICMYGTPSGTYEIDGIVRNEYGDKLDGMRVVTSFGDTAYTKEGKYQIGPKQCFPLNTVSVKAEDPDGFYKTESKELKLKYDGKGDKSGWDEGKAEATADFQLYQTEYETE